MRLRAILLVLLASAVLQAQAAQPVLQRGYDANVTGATLTETTLNTSNVGVNTFGLLFKLPVDDAIFAQPLYVPNVAVSNYGNRNVLLLATMSDTLYAFDADAPGAPLWSVNLASLFGTTAVVWANFATPPASPHGNLGILSTPAIDPSTHVMYVVACTLENSTMAYRLHAIDIATGSEPYGPGVLIAGTTKGGESAFDPHRQVQRSSLAISGNQVVFGFSTMPEEHPGNYLGWVMAYNKQTLQQSGIFAPVINENRQSGVWQSGRPPAVDNAGYVYVFSGNTHGGGYDGLNNFSESVLKLDPSNELTLVDWFTPHDWSYLDAHDIDLSGSGPLLIPGTSLLTGGGKAGELYVLRTENLGKFDATDSQIVQEQNITEGEQMLGGPVYWNRSAANGGPMLYNWGMTDVLKAYPFDGTRFASNPSAQGTAIANFPGGLLALSANGNAQGSGVLWAITPVIPHTAGPSVPAALRAFDAETVSTELWNSTMNAARDGFGIRARFVPPLVANGKVYVATESNQVAVYGLMPFTVSPTLLAFGAQTTNVASAALSLTVQNNGSAALPITSIAFSGVSAKQFSQSNTCGNSIGIGAACTISVVFKPTSTGPKTANLNVNAGGGGGTQTVALTGTGVAPPYTVSPTSLAFGGQPIGTASQPQAVTVTNSGSQVLPITSITLAGANMKQFSQTNTCGTSVGIGATCTINVVFKPTATGAKRTILNVNAGGNNGTQTVQLSGTGA